MASGRDPLTVGGRDDLSPRDPRGVESGEVHAIPARHQPRHDEAAAPRARLDQAGVPRAASPLVPWRGKPAVQVAANAPARGEVELHHDERVPEPVVAHPTVHAVAAQHTPGRRVGDAQLGRALAVVPQERHPPAVRGDARRGLRPQASGEDRAGRGPRLDLAPRRPRLPLGEQLAAAGAPHLATDAIGNELAGRALDEPRDHRVSRGLREPLEEPAAVRVRRVAVGPTGEEHRVPRRPRAARRGIGQEHLGVEAARHPAAARQPRLVVGRQPLRHPARLIGVWKGTRDAAEHALNHAPHALGAIEMEDVRELVRRDEAQPVVEVLEAGVGRGGGGEHGEPVRREHRREAVGRVDVVAEHDVDDTARRMQLVAQQLVGALSLPRLALGRRARRGSEVDPEVRGVQGAPAAGRINLSRGSPGKHAPQGECSQAPRRHGARHCCARSRRNASMPAATPRAYFHCPSSLASSASCSGIMMNAASVRAAGIHVGRASA